MTRSLVGIVIAVLALSSTAAFAEPPAAVSNTVPYRVTVPVATGRDGTATVVSRALIAHDGTTTIDIATAPFGTPAEDAITRILIRALTPSGATVFTRTYDDAIPNGSVAWTFDDLLAGQTVHLDVHVNDRALPRTDLVEIDELVRRRPDLRVEMIRAPRQVVTDAPTVITATIDEHNGDVGARANCVLLVDDIEVDRIGGMWVDAGDSVSCAFTHAFAADGSHTVRVAVTDVDPADWDASNNALERTVDVAGAFQQYYVNAGERTENQWSLKQTWTRYNGSGTINDDWVSQHSLVEWSQWIHVQGTVAHRWAFPLTAIDVTASDETGVRLSAHVADIVATNVSTGYGYDAACAMTRTGTNARYVYIYVCSRHDDAGDWSLLDFGQQDGSVSYLSVVYDRFWSGDPDNVVGYRYYDNTIIADGTGSLVPFGSAVQLGLAVTSGDTVDGIDATVPLGDATTERSDFPRLCGVDTFSWGSISFCAEAHDTITLRSGLFVAGS
jgi:hypothetical protein